MLYLERYTMRQRSRAKFFLRATLSDAWSVVTAKPKFTQPHATLIAFRGRNKLTSERLICEKRSY
jgi:hypothetical protein